MQKLKTRIILRLTWLNISHSFLLGFGVTKFPTHPARTPFKPLEMVEFYEHCSSNNLAIKIGQIMTE